VKSKLPETNEELMLQKLETLVKLQAFGLTSRFESQKEKILFLNKVGMKPKEIAELIDSTPNAVSVTILKAKKPKKASVATDPESNANSAVGEDGEQ
jgi:hypothetical protein